MRHSAGPVRLFASVILALVAADLAQEAAQTGCETKRQSCIAECRAQYFAVDPKRNACVASCVAEANRCMREQARTRDGVSESANLALCDSIF
jgi:hypothetical protein